MHPVVLFPIEIDLGFKLGDWDPASDSEGPGDMRQEHVICNLSMYMCFLIKMPIVWLHSSTFPDRNQHRPTELGLITLPIISWHPAFTGPGGVARTSSES